MASSDKLTVAIAPISEVFNAAAPKRVVTDGGMFLCAPQPVLDSALKAMFAKSRLQVPEEGLRNFNMLSLLSFSVRQRLAQFRKAWAEDNPDPQSAKEALSDISQNFGLWKPFHEWMPTLKKNTVVVSLKQKRFMIPLEHFCVNGLPLFCDIDEDSVAIPLQVFLNTSESQAQCRAGNMMHLAVVGSILELVLCCSVCIAVSTK